MLLKGYSLLSIKQSTTPNAHMSTQKPYSCSLQIQGLMQLPVPRTVYPLSESLLNPKSAILYTQVYSTITLFSFSSVFTNIFSILISRWRYPFVCTAYRPRMTSERMRVACLSVQTLSGCLPISFFKSPPLQNYITIYIQSLVSWELCSLTMYQLLSCFMTYI